jgi:hypothetical protein
MAIPFGAWVAIGLVATVLVLRRFSATVYDVIIIHMTERWSVLFGNLKLAVAMCLRTFRDDGNQKSKTLNYYMTVHTLVITVTATVLSTGTHPCSPSSPKGRGCSTSGLEQARRSLGTQHW